MPSYIYHCSECKMEFETYHGMSERPDHCENCYASSCLIRVPQLTYITKKEKAGHVVKEYIEKNKRVLEQEKEEAKNQEVE